MAKTTENGWVNSRAQRTDVHKRRPGKTAAVNLAWNGDRFAKGNELSRFGELEESDRVEIMRQMRNILELGLPPLPDGRWPECDLS